MTPLWHVNLIRLFDFYLAAAALLSFARRYPIYWDALRLTVALRGRWPRLMDRLRQHHGVLVTGQVIRPALLAVVLLGVQLVCSRVIWPRAVLPVGEVAESWWRLIVVVSAAVPMLAVDAYFLIRVGRFDRLQTEQYLDMAEHWLASWKAPAVRVVTFGYVNPRRMVDDEVKKGLTSIGQMVRWSMWWVTAQVSCRVTFGLVIWVVWLLGG
jgi:hypothetical protein